MNIETITEYAMHFLQCGADFLASPLGVVVLGMAVCLLSVYFFEDLRR